MPAPDTVRKLIEVGDNAPAPWLRQVKEALGESRPDGIAPILSMDIIDGTVHIERPRISGVTIDQRLADGPMDVKTCLRVFASIARALEQLHDRGVLHGNLKPSNIILRGDDAVLVDFGIASLRDPLDLPAITAGRYLSPEQAGLLDYETGEWSDLYSLGTIIYECLAGTAPFTADTLGGVLRQHLNTRPESLRDRGIDVPGPLEDLVMRLLRKDPRERYQTASGLLHDILALQTQSEVIIGARDQREHLTDPAFLGRAEDLRSLEAALAQARSGKAALCYVEAESGAGKTRLLQEFAHRARLQDAWITYGQGRDQVAPRPFGMLEGLDESLGTLKAIEPARAARIIDLATEDSSAITQALPALTHHFGEVDVDETGPDEYGQARTIGALARLLMTMGTPEQPAILLLDDLQWADSPTRRLLAQWWLEAQDSPCHLVVVGAFRREEVDEDDIIRTLATDHWLRLAPFNRDDVAGLMRSMAGPVEERAIDFVARMADGNPFMASAVLRGLAESGDLEPQGDGWRLRPEADLVGDATMVQFLLRRMDQLPDETRRLLAVAAVLGKEFEAEVAASLAGLSADATLVTLHGARQRHILVHTDRQGTFAFTHDKLREAVLAGLDESELTQLHRAAATQIQSTTQDVAFDLAYHFDAAGDAEAALPHALLAADQARRQFVLDVAENYYSIAHRGMTNADVETRYRVLSGMGETLVLRGQYQEAAPWFEQAKELTTDRMGRAHLASRIGDLWFKKGDLDKAATAIVEGLKELNEPAPTTKAGHIVRLPWEVLVQTWNSIFPSRAGRHENSPRKEKDLLAADLYSSLAHINWFLRGPLCTGFAHLREMNIAERYAPSSQVAMAYAEHSVVMTTAPWHARGIDYGQRALEVRIGLDQAWGQGHARHFYALGLLASGRLNDALENVQEAGRIFQRTGDLWQANNAGWNIAYILARQGDLEAGHRVALQYFEAADRIGDLQNTGLALWAWAYSGGRGMTRDIIDNEIERCPAMDAQTGEAVHQADGLWYLQHDEPGKAVAAFQRAEAIANSASLRSEYVVGIPLWVATAARLASEKMPAWDQTSRKQMVRLARKSLRRGMLTTALYPAHRPHAFRELAIQHAWKGRLTKARRALARSVKIADELGMSLESWESRNLYQEMATPDWPDLGPMRLAVPRHDHAATATLSIVDRFQSLIGSGRHIVAAVKQDEVLERLRRAADQTLRGEEVHVIAVDDPEPRFQGLIRLGENLEGPVVLRDEELLTELGARSGVIVPINVRGVTQHVMVALHQQIDNLYGEQEIATGQFLAALAGVALENAAGYVALEASRDKERLQTSLLQSQADAMVEAAIVVDDEEHVLTFNRRLQEIWGFPSHILEAKDGTMFLAEIGAQLDDAEAWASLIDTTHENPDASGTIEMNLTDGRILNCYTAPVVDDRKRYGRAWYFRDVSREFRDQQSLREAYDRLQDVDRMKTAFLNTAAHELNTPLTPIKIQLSMLRPELEDRMNDDEKESFDVLSRNIARLQTLIGDILDTVKLEGDRLRVKPEDVKLAPLMNEIHASFEPAARARDIDLRIDVDGELKVHADPTRIHQVIFNLVSNAMRFCKKQVTLRAWVDQQAHISVTDDGTGLTPAQISQLFEPFSQPVESPEGQALGTGLGLHICKGLVEEHNGRLEVSSDGPGKGATFTVTLPIK